MPDFIAKLHRSLVVAVIRADRAEVALSLARSAALGGIDLIEISYYTPNLDEILTQLSSQLPQCLFGVGTLTDRASTELALDWGSKFLFSPFYSDEIVHLAQDRGIPIVAGAATPTEVFRAWQGGATAVKVFPIANLGGATYIKALQQVFPAIPLIPTGGVTLNNAAQLLGAGAIGLGISSDLFLTHLVAQQDWTAITDRVKQLRASIGL